jgi:hypothetical protein
MSGPVLVLTMVEAKTETAHLVGIEVASRHRIKGVYPALCGAEVHAASLTSLARRRCAKCDDLAGKPQPRPAPIKRFRVPFQWRRGER